MRDAMKAYAGTLMRRYRAYVLAAGLVLLALFLRFHRLGAQSFSYEEGYAVYIASLEPGETLFWSSRDLVPPLHSCLLALWMSLAGASEFSSRFLSVWMGVLSVAALIRMGKELDSPGGGVLAGLLAAVSPFYVWYSQEARMYMPLVVLSLLATLWLLRALKRPTDGWLWAGVAVLDGLVLYTHSTGVLLLLFHVLVLTWHPSPLLEKWKGGGLALGGSVLIWLPWLVYALPFLKENAGYWPGQLDWRLVVSTTFREFVSGHLLDGQMETLTLVVWGTALLIAPVALVTGSRREQGVAIFLLAYLAVPILALLLLFRNVPKFAVRYIILASPPVFLLPAAAFAKAMRFGWVSRTAGGAAVAALVMTSCVGLGNLYSDPAYSRPGFREAARIVREQMSEEEIVLVLPGHLFTVWQLYFGSQGWEALPDDPILNVRHELEYRNIVVQLNQWLGDSTGVWLVEWEPWVVDPTGMVAYLLGQAGEMAETVDVTGGVRLHHYRLYESYAGLPLEPRVPGPVSVSWGLPLELMGCDYPSLTNASEPVRVDCFWESRGRLPPYLSVSLRLVDGVGRVWSSIDTAISGPYLLAGRWPQREPVLGQYLLQPATAVPDSAEFWLELVVYEPDGVRYGRAVVGGIVVNDP